MRNGTVSVHCADFIPPANFGEGTAAIPSAGRNSAKLRKIGARNSANDALRRTRRSAGRLFSFFFLTGGSQMRIVRKTENSQEEQTHAKVMRSENERAYAAFQPLRVSPFQKPACNLASLVIRCALTVSPGAQRRAGKETQHVDSTRQERREIHPEKSEPCTISRTVQRAGPVIETTPCLSCRPSKNYFSKKTNSQSCPSHVS